MRAPSLLLVALCACVAVACVSAGTVSPRQQYDGHAVLRVDSEGLTPKQHHALEHITDNQAFKIDRWAWNDLMVGPSTRGAVEAYLREHELPFHVSMPDLGAEIQREEAQWMNFKRTHGGDVLKAGADAFFTAYHTLDDIRSFAHALVEKYPGRVREEIIGRSYENRPIWAYHVSGDAKNSNVSAGASKPVIFLEFGIHSREWISQATGTYMLNEFVTQYGVDSHITNILDNFDYTFVPSVNPDGYVWTWTNDRMWRKTRTPNPGSRCMGTDPNRNWDNHWCQAGATRDPCSDAYCGPKAFSEIEVASIAEYARNNTNIVAFVDFHSYSQFWMTPYGYTKSYPANFADQDGMAKAAVSALQKVYGTKFKEGTIYSVVYPASGSSADYLYDNTTHIKYAFGVELRDTGAQGFMLDAKQIVPSGIETLEAILAMGDYLLAHPTADRTDADKADIHINDILHKVQRRETVPEREAVSPAQAQFADRHGKRRHQRQKHRKVQA